MIKKEKTPVESSNLYFCFFLGRNANVSLSWPQGGWETDHMDHTLAQELNM